MQINIKAHNTSLTPAIADYVNKRLGGLEKFIKEKSNDASLDVEVGKTTNHHNTSETNFEAKAKLNVGTMHLRCQATDMDLYAAIDKLRDELARDMTSEKSKRLTMVRRGGQKIKAMLRSWRGAETEAEVDGEASL